MLSPPPSLPRFPCPLLRRLRELEDGGHGVVLEPAPPRLALAALLLELVLGEVAPAEP